MKYGDLDKQASAQLGLITYSQLLDSYSRRQIDRMREHGIIDAIRPEIYRVAGSPSSFEQTVLAIQLMIPQSIASHRTAAFLWGLIEADQRDSHIELTVPTGGHRRLAQVRFHQSDITDRTRSYGGLEVTNPARTLIDLACKVQQRELVYLVEKAIMLDLLTFSFLRNEVQRIAARGRDGVGVTRELLDEYDPQAERCKSPLQRKLRRALLTAGLPDPAIEHCVRTTITNRYLDLAYPEIKLGIEADSRRWHTRVSDFDNDTLRDGELAEVGWGVIHVTYANLDEAVTRIARIFKARSAPPSPNL